MIGTKVACIFLYGIVALAGDVVIHLDGAPVSRQVIRYQCDANASKELVTLVSEKVIAAEIRRRSWRVQAVQQRVDKMLELSESRAKMYAEQMAKLDTLLPSAIGEDDLAAIPLRELRRRLGARL
jgi:hypothetical protein